MSDAILGWYDALGLADASQSARVCISYSQIKVELKFDKFSNYLQVLIRN